MRLDRVDYDDEIYEADINNVRDLKKDSFEFALCRFICEVKKVNSDENYTSRTLYQMVCSLQNHLKKNKCDWKLVHNNNEFQKFQQVLDKVMQERSSQNLGMVKKQAQIISLEFENTLWEKAFWGRILQTS